MKSEDKEKYIPALSFDFLTPIYDPVVALTTREKVFKSELINQVALQPAQRILDLGCGTATLTVALKESYPEAEVFGLDGDAKILEIARRKADKAGAEIKFETGLSYKMPYRDAYFDSVVSSLFFHHLTPENKRKTLDEVFRVLKPDGVLLVGDWGKPANFLMRIVSMPVQWLDGATTRDSFQGMLPKFMMSAGFREVVETGSFNSVFGTIRLHQAEKG
jgi:ubiquinone/menaquinone biosynthesis C-methylase UbiE